MASRQRILAVKLEREKFKGLLAKHQIRQHFPLSITCAIQDLFMPIISCFKYYSGSLQFLLIIMLFRGGGNNQNFGGSNMSAEHIEKF